MTLKRLKTLIFFLLTTVQLWAGGPVWAAGTIPLAMSVQTDTHGNFAAGCLLNFYVAGTVATPQDSFVDFGLTTKNPNPLRCDQSGRLPMFWLADGLIHVTLTDSSGVPIVDTTMQVLGPSSGGGGGGGTVDPTSIASTGDEKFRYDNAPITGWVRENGLTLGNATSGATERANADTQALFIYLYGKDSNLVVSGGRSGNALNDYNASKTITLPDMRGRGAVALADMGNSASSTLPNTYCSSPTTLGFSCGSASATLAITNLPPYTPSGTVSTSTTLSGSPLGSSSLAANAGAVSSGNPQYVNNNVVGASSSSTFTGVAQGGADTPFGILGPIMLRTYYIKL